MTATMTAVMTVMTMMTMTEMVTVLTLCMMVGHVVIRVRVRMTTVRHYTSGLVVMLGVRTDHRLTAMVVTTLVFTTREAALVASSCVTTTKLPLLGRLELYFNVFVCFWLATLVMMVVFVMMTTVMTAF